MESLVHLKGGKGSQSKHGVEQMIEKQVTNLDSLPESARAKLMGWQLKERKAYIEAKQLLEALTVEHVTSSDETFYNKAIGAFREYSKIKANRRRAFTIARKKYPAMTEYVLTA